MQAIAHTPAKAAARKAPAKATPAPATGRKAAKATPVQAAPVLALGKPFAPKAGGKYAQVENWAVVVATAPATRADLIAAIKAAAEVGGYANRCNAAGFVQGRMRDGNLV